MESLIDKMAGGKYTEEEIRACISMLQDLAGDPAEFAHLTQEQKTALLKVTGQISRPDRDQIRSRKKHSVRLGRKRIVEHERRARKATGIRSAREASLFTAPKQMTDPGARSVPKNLEL